MKLHPLDRNRSRDVKVVFKDGGEGHFYGGWKFKIKFFVTDATGTPFCSIIQA